MSEVIALTRLYILSSPEEAAAVSAAGLSPARLSYIMTGTGQLYLSKKDAGGTGGLLALTKIEELPQWRHETAARRLRQECVLRRLDGVFMPEGTDVGFIKTAAGILRDKAVYCAAAPIGENIYTVIGSAISGGTLCGMLQSAGENAGLLITPVRAEFTLPSPSGEGTPISADTLAAMTARGDKAYFSRELCENYITYRRGGRTYLTLFDNENSVAEKVRAAHSCGTPAVFARYGDVAQMLHTLGSIQAHLTGA